MDNPCEIRIHVIEQVHFPHYLGLDSKKCFWHLYVNNVYRIKNVHASIISTTLRSGFLFTSLQNRQ